MFLGQNALTAVWTWVSNNKQWLFSGAGVVVLLFLLRILTNAFKTKRAAKASPTSMLSNELDAKKLKTRILFIDDDTSFKVVDILKTAGWINTSIQEDVSALNDINLVAADIVFVDIQGVGRALGFRDDGLGLTQAIKERYPNKHVVVYSAENRGNRFHDGLKAADDFLSKTAQPYEFQKIVEDYVQGQPK